ncbi:hypothetical protein LY76DRAFT_200966 [Colletotrichum caudatum]|nr:hypothetical protein LY76DRAFT_200966 [Colletotrichum caudatum]
MTYPPLSLSPNCLFRVAVRVPFPSPWFRRPFVSSLCQDFFFTLGKKCTYISPTDAAPRCDLRSGGGKSAVIGRFTCDARLIRLSPNQPTNQPHVRPPGPPPCQSYFLPSPVLPRETGGGEGKRRGWVSFLLASRHPPRGQADAMRDRADA